MVRRVQQEKLNAWWITGQENKLARTQAKDYHDKRAAILKSSAKLFGRDGYAYTSMAGVAATCGVSKALLYHYYESKEELLFDIIFNHLSDLGKVTNEAADLDIDADQRLGAMINGLLELYRDADDEHRVQTNSLSALPEKRQEQLKGLERQLVRAFSSVLKEAVPSLGEPGAPLLPVTMSLFGMLNWHYMWFRKDGPVSRSDYGKIVKTLILEGARKL